MRKLTLHKAKAEREKARQWLGRVKGKMAKRNAEEALNFWQGKVAYLEGMRGNSFKVGDKVKLRQDVLVRHSRSVPAHAGFTTEQFKWRETLDKYANHLGTVTRVFPGSKHINITFKDGLIIGIDNTELEKARKTSKSKVICSPSSYITPKAPRISTKPLRITR